MKQPEHPLYDRVLAWARSEEDVAAMLLVGSYGRADGSHDSHSDLDISVFTDNHRKYDCKVQYFQKIAPVWAYESERTEDDYPGWLLIFEGCHNVDFTFYPTEVLELVLAGRHLPQMYGEGYKVIYERDGRRLPTELPTGKVSASRLPSIQEFQYAVNVYFFECYHVAKYLSRNELWTARSRYPEHRLLQMIEWNALAKGGSCAEIRSRGLRMQKWAGSSVWNRLGDVFPHFDKQDGWDKLMKSLAFFRDLGRETAALIGYGYPEELDENMTGCIAAMRE